MLQLCNATKKPQSTRYNILNMNLVSNRYKFLAIAAALLLSWVFVLFPNEAAAVNILEYSDVISDSAPNAPANHTLSFVLNTDISPSSQIEVTPPDGFEILATSTFDVRNVQLFVDGVPRVSTTTPSPGVDGVDITTGSPGFIRYTLAPDSGISSSSNLELRIGSHTGTANAASTGFSTSTGTTTTAADVEPIVNSSVLGRHDVQMEIYDGGLVANADFVIFLNRRVSMPNIDTTEEIPPYRFNGSPTSTVGGTTLSVEISLETDEFAFCRYSTTAGTAFGSMTELFSNTGLIYHSTVVAVTPGTLATFYVRCIDDEGNFNIDDYIISFVVNEQPTGTANDEGSTEGDGTGSGDSGTGTGDGGGGTEGEADGEAPLEGGSSGTGGGGGGGGGGSGGNSGSSAGGGFESEDAPYRSGDGRVVVSGYAYPNSTVSILVDGNFVDSTRTNSRGEYDITIDEIARGAYTFGVYAEDGDDTRSSTFSTSFTVTGARTSALSNINIAPTILVTPDPVDPGQTVTFSGSALPNATVTVENSRINLPATDSLVTTSNGAGLWSIELSTQGFSRDTYQVRARSEQDGGAETQFSNYTFYGVGQDAELPINADLNRDGSVNLIDFSILLFWWNSNGGDSDPPADINLDGSVNLTDFSILLFNWTG